MILPPGAVHVCFLNTVSRFVFAYESDVGGLGVKAIARPAIRRLVEWDKRAAQRPTQYVANSRNVAQRLKRHYSTRLRGTAPSG